MESINFMKIDKTFNERYFSGKSLRKNMFLLLGNTLGNFAEGALLQSISDAMNQGDVLLVDNQLKKDGLLSSDEIMALKNIYSSEEEKRNVFAVLKKGNIFPIHGSVQQDTTNVFADSTLSGDDCIAVLQQFRFKETTPIKIGEKTTRYQKGHIITLFYSKRYTKDALNRIVFEEVGFKKVDDFSTTEYAMLLCQKE